ncbi:hypothetical protein [Agathobacter rectalis]|jgi:predicted SprT family Zn-dependent metalloprotease|uniref:Uncharacterized protein n=1 Tax=Agathobacter rectalis TaxID=39491 RepID=A0A3E5AL63_9FIRM|nr:hypothetical protein [Agathobacter rectalis]MBO9144147.1 hypothetical protein [Escherichia coli]RGN16405.1 hypothetical protein DXB76_11220 [Agathobacter rectalis]RGN21502.1 hypothetical protein DXB72_11885 [Agathobacter rectalis]RGN21838.1 hypothetical protein DXB69_12405 [Agathobacter rectalis]
MATNYESVLRETLSEEAFAIISTNDIEFKHWLERVLWNVKKVNESAELFQKDEVKEPIRQDMCTCPQCGTYNETIKKRRNTVAIDVVYCWHCGQAISVKQLN